jgi:hypothetical protein
VLEGILGHLLTSVLVLYAWIGLAAVLLVLAFIGSPRQCAFVYTLLSLAFAAFLVETWLGKVWPALYAPPFVFLGFAFWLWFGPSAKPGRLKAAARVGLLVLVLAALGAGLGANAFVNGRFGALEVGPIPAGTPVNLIMNMNPEAPLGDLVNGGASLLRGTLIVKERQLTGAAALKAFDDEAGLPLMRVSKCPDFVLDRGHWFGEALSDGEKTDLKAFLKTL